MESKEEIIHLINKTYEKVLGRPADTDGLDHYLKRWLEKKDPLNSVEELTLILTHSKEYGGPLYNFNGTVKDVLSLQNIVSQNNNALQILAKHPIFIYEEGLTVNINTFNKTASLYYKANPLVINTSTMFYITDFLKNFEKGDPMEYLMNKLGLTYVWNIIIPLYSNKNLSLYNQNILITNGNWNTKYVIAACGTMFLGKLVNGKFCEDSSHEINTYIMVNDVLMASRIDTVESDNFGNYVNFNDNGDFHFRNPDN